MIILLNKLLTCKHLNKTKFKTFNARANKCWTQIHRSQNKKKTNTNHREDMITDHIDYSTHYTLIYPIFNDLCTLTI